MFNIKNIVVEYKQGKQLKSLADQYKCSTDKIRYWLQQEGVWLPAKPHKCNFSSDQEQNIVNLYKQDVPKEDIAKMYQVSTGPIVKILNKCGVRKPTWAKDLPYATYLKLSNREYVTKIFTELISHKEIMSHFDIASDMIRAIVKKYNIKMHNSAEVRSLNNQKEATLPFNKETFIDAYLNEQISVEEISKQMGISCNYLRRIANKNWGISTNNEIRLSKQFKLVRNNKELLQQEVSTNTIKSMTLKYKVSWDVLRRTLTKHNISIPIRYSSVAEKQIANFVKSSLPENTNIIFCDRKTIYPFELDILIPSHNLAIEYCGLYWHSELNNKGKNYHLNKQIKCREKGITLITIFEDEYTNSPILVENRILHQLGIFTGKKINARDCVVKQITFKEKADFLNEFHIQGNDTSSILLGLFFNNLLISVMTFGRPNRSYGSNKMSGNPTLWELKRYATNYNYMVRGGAGKLLSYFKKQYSWSQIYSYADRRWSQGNMYIKLGFSLHSTSKPNYWYVPQGYYKREYRFTYAKYKLVEQGFDKNLTEDAIMKQRKFTKIWDCGMLKYTLINTL